MPPMPNSTLTAPEPVASTSSTNLPVVEEADASPEVHALYADFRERFGRPRIPGILKCFATHPPLLRHMMGLAEAMLFEGGALGRGNKELLATFLSAQNGCTYCADSHGASLLEQSGSPSLLEAALACNAASSALDPPRQALLRFVRKINDLAGRLEPNDIAEVRAAGWNDLQIAEAIHLAALFACFNRVVSAFGVPSQELLATFATHADPSAGTA